MVIKITLTLPIQRALVLGIEPTTTMDNRSLAVVYLDVPVNATAEERALVARHLTDGTGVREPHIYLVTRHGGRIVSAIGVTWTDVVDYLREVERTESEIKAERAAAEAKVSAERAAEEAKRRAEWRERYAEFVAWLALPDNEAMVQPHQPGERPKLPERGGISTYDVKIDHLDPIERETWKRRCIILDRMIDSIHEWDKAKAAADKAVREAAELAWIEAHGSDLLKRMIAAGMPHGRRLDDERLAVEMPGWAYEPDDLYPGLDPAMPSEPEMIERLLDLMTGAPDGTKIVLLPEADGSAYYAARAKYRGIPILSNARVEIE